MNMYIKPSAMFITASGTAGMGVSCSTSREDVELIMEILGITDMKNAFSKNEACGDQYDMVEYCKFTSVENGSMKILTS
ncbi:MAG: hypothetical protein E7530_09020 [Ruminococcaceae bacterium]|nr:hypothetical protein [Oscillospiraceae bacterium]